MASGWATERGIVLDPTGEVPLGVQLDWALRTAVTSGRLQPGERLPALRELAEQLGVNHNTLRAAVAKLESDGLLSSRHGAGTFVAPGAEAHERQAPLVEQVVRWAGDAGVSPRDLAAALYVSEPPVPARDEAAEERRALRDDIAVLDRLLVQLEARLPQRLPPPPVLPGHGAQLLSTAQLRAHLDALVRRLAEAQRLLDEEEDNEDDEPDGEAPAPAARAAPKPARRASRPGIAPA